MHDGAALAREFVAREPGAAAEPGRVRVVAAPGRVNLMGEHTDYNDGFVLPCAIDIGISIAVIPTEDRHVEIELLETGERRSFDVDRIGPRTGTWIDYVAGTAWSLAQEGVGTSGFRGLLASDLPRGAGLSSSAALELAAAFALTRGAPPPVDRMALARLAQRAENEYVGVSSGLMDQFAATFGEGGHALLLDCRSLEHRAVRLPLDDVALVVCDSGSPHRLTASAYNERRSQCEAGVAAIAALEPSVRSLRDVTPELLDRVADRLEPIIRARVEHIVTENVRVLESADAIEAGDLERLGRLFAESHASLRDGYEVSSPALDALVEIATGVPGVIGARLTGAGFGGCTINLVRRAAVDALREAVLRGYPARTGLTPRVFEVEPSAGARVTWPS